MFAHNNSRDVPAHSCEFPAVPENRPIKPEDLCGVASLTLDQHGVNGPVSAGWSPIHTPTVRGSRRPDHIDRPRIAANK
jgi:hypothetical protein